jgi:hypothetical protein
MNRYQNNTPRAAFAIVAVVMSLATMTAFVGAPALADNDGLTVVARATHATPVTISPARIEVVARFEAPVTVADATARAVR